MTKASFGLVTAIIVISVTLLWGAVEWTVNFFIYCDCNLKSCMLVFSLLQVQSHDEAKEAEMGHGKRSASRC